MRRTQPGLDIRRGNVSVTLGNSPWCVLAAIAGGLGLLAVAMLSASGPAAAAPGTAQERAACTPDVWRLCSSEVPNVSKIVACLNRNSAKLSPACRKVMGG
jgi:hypothetical protein